MNDDVVLADNRYAPITSHVGFLRLGLTETAERFAQWRRWLYGSADSLTLDGGLRENIHRLEPLTIGARPRELLIGTRNSEWTAYLDCDATGTDPISAIGFMSRECRVDGLAVDAVPMAPRGGAGPWGGRQFEMFGPASTSKLGGVRWVSLTQDGSSLHFEVNGTPQPFEDLDAYTRRRKTDRFTGAMLESYCRALGLDPFDLDFYNGPSVLLTSPIGVPVEKQMSLAAARERLHIPPIGTGAPDVGL